MNLSIVQMNSEHIDDIEKLEKECFSHPWSRNDIAAQLENKNAHFLTAEVDGKVAGYIGIYELYESCEIANLAVTSDMRRKGIACELLKSAVSGAISRGRDFITLEVRESNTPAILLYTKLGFENAGRRKNFYTSPSEDAIIMTKYFKEKA